MGCCLWFGLGVVVGMGAEDGVVLALGVWWASMYVGAHAIR